MKSLTELTVVKEGETGYLWIGGENPIIKGTPRLIDGIFEFIKDDGEIYSMFDETEISRTFAETKEYGFLRCRSCMRTYLAQALELTNLLESIRLLENTLD